MKIQKLTWFAALLAAGLMTASCGGDDKDDDDSTETDAGTDATDDAETTPEPEEKGTVAGTFHYSGDVEGMLRVAIFNADPSLLSEEDARMAIKNIISADAEQQNDLVFEDNLDPGDYWLLLVHDLAPITDATALEDNDVRKLYDFDLSTPSTYDPFTIVSGETTDIGEVVMGAGTISGTLTYEGAESGNALVAAYETFPPQGAPVAVTIIETPFAEGTTYEYSLGAIPDGDLFVVAGFDIDADGITSPELSAVYGAVSFNNDGRVHENIDMVFPDGVGFVNGTVSYDGEEEGQLTVGLFEEFPPPAGTMPAAYQSFELGTDFPISYDLQYAPRGEYTLAALYDTNADGAPDNWAFQELTIDDDNLQHDDIGLVLPPGTASISGTIFYDVHTSGELMVLAFTEFPPPPGTMPIAASPIGTVDGDGEAEFALTRLDGGEYYVVGSFDFLPDEVNPGPEVFALSFDTPILVETGQAVTDDEINLVTGAGSIAGQLQIQNNGAFGVFMVAAFEGEFNEDSEPLAYAGPFILEAENLMLAEEYLFEFLPEGDYTLVAAFDGSGEPEFDAERFFFAGEVYSITEDDQNLEDTVVQAAIGSGDISGNVNYYGALDSGLVIYGLFPVVNGLPDTTAPIYGDFDSFDEFEGTAPAVYAYDMFYTPHGEMVPFAGIDMDGDMQIEAMGFGEPFMFEEGADVVENADIDVYDPSQSYCTTFFAACDTHFEGNYFADEAECLAFIGGVSDIGNSGDDAGMTQNCFLTKAVEAQMLLESRDDIVENDMEDPCFIASNESEVCE